MPEITAVHIGIIVVALIIGTVIGWIGRGGRTSGEKAAINAGWKDVGVHKDHALVVVNHGNGSGKEVKNLAMEINNSVISKFGIELTSEVNII